MNAARLIGRYYNSSTFNKCLSGIIGGAVVGLLVSFAFRKEVVSQNLEEDNKEIHFGGYRNLSVLS